MWRYLADERFLCGVQLSLTELPWPTPPSVYGCLNPPLKNTTSPPFLSQPPVKSQNCPSSSPSFQAILPYILVFRAQKHTHTHTHTHTFLILLIFNLPHCNFHQGLLDKKTAQNLYLMSELLLSSKNNKMKRMVFLGGSGFLKY